MFSLLLAYLLAGLCKNYSTIMLLPPFKWRNQPLMGDC